MEETNVVPTKETVSLVESFLKELFERIGIKAEFEVSIDKASDAIIVEIKNETEKGLLIGNRGETLNSLAQAVKGYLKNKTDSWYKVVLNIGDWREKQEEYLKGLVENTIERIKATGSPQALYNLNPMQRRTVHMIVTEHADLESHSEGEGRDRCLIISKK